jgi:adenylate kinase family enzyme
MYVQVVSLLSSRLSGSWDAMQNGFMLDGFPRSTKQAD